MIGQINLGNEFGNTIYTISKNHKYSTFCEVGTWNGCGSTKCIYEGIRDRDAVFYSIEGDKNMYAEAAKQWNNIPNVHLLYGTLHRNIMSRAEVETHPLYSRIIDHYKLWYTTESEAVYSTPLIQVPPCDVILLDGGEFSTHGDWNVLKHPNLKVVILDDTQVIKTNAIREELLCHPEEWRCTHDRPFDRNGWAVFEHV
jgi:hypothetical protein